MNATNDMDMAGGGARTEYVVSGLSYDDGAPVTFMADDVDAAATDFASLIGLVTSDPSALALPAVDPDHAEYLGWAHWCAFEAVVDQLTNFSELARLLCRDEPLLGCCDGCNALPANHGVDFVNQVKCVNCARSTERLRLLGLGIAAWARSHWPGLQLTDGGRYSRWGAFDDDELAGAIRSLQRRTTTPEVAQ